MLGISRASSTVSPHVSLMRSEAFDMIQIKNSEGKGRYSRNLHWALLLVVAGSDVAAVESANPVHSSKCLTHDSGVCLLICHWDINLSHLMF